MLYFKIPARIRYALHVLRGRPLAYKIDIQGAVVSRPDTMFAHCTFNKPLTTNTAYEITTGGSGGLNITPNGQIRIVDNNMFTGGYGTYQAWLDNLHGDTGEI